MSKAKRLWLVLLANVSMVLALVIVGLVSHSLGVLAAGGDLGDAAGSRSPFSRFASPAIEGTMRAHRLT